MKSILLIGILFLASIICIPITTANPTVIIDEYTLSPETVMPGDSALLTLTIKNAETTATTTTADVDGSVTVTTTKTIGATLDNIWITPAYDGTRQIRATLNYADIGALAPASSIDVSFKILVDQNMSEGVYFITARVDVETYQDVSYPIPIKVQNTSVELLSNEVPSKISMSGATEITLTALNKRDAAVDGITITPNPVENVTFIPENVFIGTLAAETSEDVTFSIKPDELGDHNFTFNISYLNGDNLHCNTLTLPIEVIETLDVAPIITNFPISITKGGSSRITIEVYNAKTETITGVLVTPICDATVVPSQYFIGSMEADDVFSASFDIYADTIDYGDYTIGFIVSFKQGNDYYETPVVSKTFSVISGPGTSYQSSGSASQSGSNGASAGSSLLTCVVSFVVLIIVVIVVVIFFIRWRKRQKEK